LISFELLGMPKSPQPFVEVVAEAGDHVEPPPPEILETDPDMSPEEAEQTRKDYLLRTKRTGNFEMKNRKPLKITSRTSSITNSFVQAIIPSMPSSEHELNEVLTILGMSTGDLACVYCGGAATDWDHLRPLVRNRKPTGYVDDVRNRVPSCSRCNQSKSGADWRKWMAGNALGSPQRRNIAKLAERMQRLEAFEKWGAVEQLQLADLVGEDHWNVHWKNRDDIVDKMREAQKYAEHLKSAIQLALDKRES
jgi:hypothetical protein